MRWDFRQQQVNRALEKVIAKTVAAFMNSDGGTLVVGVSDEGNPLGIESDLATLRPAAGPGRLGADAQKRTQHVPFQGNRCAG